VLEAVLTLLVELLSELILPILGELALEFGIESVRGSLERWRVPGKVAFATGAIVLGCLLGLASVIVLPERLLPVPRIRGVSLVVVPVVAGVTMHLFGAWWRARGHSPSTFASFWCDFLFALAFALVRFLQVGG
jgi:hypothetical protein